MFSNFQGTSNAASIKGENTKEIIAEDNNINSTISIRVLSTDDCVTSTKYNVIGSTRTGIKD